MKYTMIGWLFVDGKNLGRCEATFKTNGDNSPPDIESVSFKGEVLSMEILKHFGDIVEIIFHHILHCKEYEEGDPFKPGFFSKNSFALPE